MIRFTTFPWGVLMPAHPDQRLAPKTKADANRLASALRMIADHLERVGGALPEEGPDDRHAMPHMRAPVVDAVAQPKGVSFSGRIHTARE